jgi:hypothetical protein
MLHEQRVQRDPVALGDDLAESCLGLLGGPCVHDAEPVRDAVHVGVHRDRRDPVAEDEDAVRGLRADMRQAEELLHRPGHDAVEPFEDLPSAVPDRARLRAVEPGLPDQRLDRSRVGGCESGGVRVPGEQSGAGDIRRLVARPLRQDGPDQHLERILGVVAQVRDAPVAPVVERGEPVHDDLPVEGRRRSHRTVPCGVLAGAAPGYAPVPGSERSGSSAAPCAARSSSPTR